MQPNATIHSKRKTLAAIFFLFGTLLVALAPITAQSQTQERIKQSSIQVNPETQDQPEIVRLAQKAQITLIQAIKLVSAGNFGSAVVGARLDNQNGNLVYSVQVLTQSNRLVEVLVDAGNGRILGSENGHADMTHHSHEGDARRESHQYRQDSRDRTYQE